MKVITHTSTLFYYDGPQVFEARDRIGGHYIAVMVDPADGLDRYVVTGVAPEQLREFRSGAVDLRSLLLASGQDEWFLVRTPGGLDKPLTLEPQRGDLASSSFLPDEGFLLHDRPTDALALREARARNNLVLELAAEPPEAATDHRIRVGTLIGLLSHVQTMVKHAYGAALRELSPDNRRLIDKTDAHLMDVIVPAAAGSFRIVLESANPPDLLKHSEVARALRRLDDLFADAANPQQTLASAKAHRGHLAGAYLRLLRFLVQHRTGLRYAWAEPAFTEPRQRGVTQAEAGPLVEILSGVSNLGSESVTLIGEFEKVNRGSGSWGLLTEDGLVSGRVKDGGPTLDGLKVGGRYRFSCVEEIEEVEGTGREVRTYYLSEYEPT